MFHLFCTIWWTVPGGTASAQELPSSGRNCQSLPQGGRGGGKAGWPAGKSASARKEALRRATERSPTHLEQFVTSYKPPRAPPARPSKRPAGKPSATNSECTPPEGGTGPGHLCTFPSPCTPACIHTHTHTPHSHTGLRQGSTEVCGYTEWSRQRPPQHPRSLRF